MMKPPPILVRIQGGMVDASMLGPEIKKPQADPRWSVYAANRKHPSVPPGVFECWLSRIYFVQVANNPSEQWKRITILRRDSREITERWDELQRIKDDIAGREALAVEVFPPSTLLVNVAPMRHLFIVPEGFVLPCLWKR